MLKRIAAFALLCASVALGAPTLVSVSQILYRADGTPAQGTLYVSWQAFDTVAGEHVPAGSKEVRLTSTGLASVSLVPNVGSTPSGTKYTVQYRLDLGQPRTVAWTVPNSGPVTITSIESTTLVPPSSIIALSQLGQGGATTNQCLVWTGTVWAAGACSTAATAFSGITTGTNTTTLTIGSGGSMVRSGTGIIDANKILSTTLTSLTGVIRMDSGIPSVATAGTDYENPLTFSNGLTRSTNAVSGVNAAADGSTKGVAAFTAADFNASSGLISLDYTNGQKATGSLPGFLSAADWTSFDSAARSTANDTNVTLSLSSHVLTAGWTGTLAKARIVATAVYNDQSNTWSTGTQDWSAVTHSLPLKVGTSNPGTCTLGEMLFRSDATAGQNLYGCTASNTWTQQAGGGGGSGSSYTQSFTAQTSVTLTHSLASTTIVVECFDNGTPPQQIGWNTLQLTDSNNATVTFTDSTTGSCNVIH